MRRELAELEAREASPAFWEDAFGHSGMLVRRHRLSVEVRRLEILRGELDAVRELAEASFLEADDSVARELTDAYARLERRLGRATRELVDFDATDQGDAHVVVTPAGSGDGADAWAEALAAMPDGMVAAVPTPVVPAPVAEEAGSPAQHRDDKRGVTELARVVVSPSDADEPAAPAGPTSTNDGSPIRSYDQWHSHGVRDRVTGHVEGDVRRVLGGRLDGFLEAHVDQRVRAQGARATA